MQMSNVSEGNGRRSELARANVTAARNSAGQARRAAFSASVDAGDAPGGTGVAPGQASVAAADLQDAFAGEIGQLMQALDFRTFGVFLDGHGVCLLV
jgi:hypothetical protein